MNIQNLKQIKIQLEKELSDSMKLFGTKEYSILVIAYDSIRSLISRLENPEDYKKHEKLVNGR